MLKEKQMNPLIPTYLHLFDSQLSDLNSMKELRRKRKFANSLLQKEKITHQMRILNRVIIDRSAHLKSVDEIIYISGSKIIKDVARY